MNKSDWEYPTGWPETKAQRDELKNALLERMLSWDTSSRHAPEKREWQPKSHVELRNRLRRSRLCPNRIPTRVVQSVGEWITKLHHQTQQLIVRDGLKCHWCKRTCGIEGWAPGQRLPPLYPTRDHIIRVKDGGSGSLHNLVLACNQCNGSRHAKGWTPPQ